jgi:BASS family bile acid:Na+ symporter
VLRAAAWLAPAAGELARQIGPGTGEFLAEWVALPSLLGMLARRLAGEARSAAAGPAVGCVSGLVLLVLCYANAASCLPRAVLGPSWAFLGLTAVAVVGLCALSFAAGLGLGRLARADAPQRASLAFGLGMSNNGTGLVLASAALTEFPQAMLPLVLYTLVQHLGAGAVEALLRRETEPAEETSGPIGWSLVPSATPAD